jgi:5-methylcytosine-specific restriction endonuclease McrA
MTRRLADLTPEQAEHQRVLRRAANRRWRDAHPGPGRRPPFPGGPSAYDAAYRAAHLEEHRAYMAVWRAGHREQIRAQKRAAYAAHPQRAIERARRWVEENPSRRRAIAMAASANTRAAEAGAHGRLSADDVTAMWRRQPHCLMCGDGVGLDHVIPLSRGGSNTTGNIQNLCRRCNARKGTKLPEELVA